MIFVSFSIEKIQSPALTVPPFSHLTTCTPTNSNLYLAYSLVTVVSEPDLYRFLTFQVPNLRSLFHCFGCTTTSVQIQGTCIHFITNELLAPRPNPKLEDHPLSATYGCLFNIYADTPHIGGHSSIRNLKIHHAVVTGTHLLWQSQQ